MSKFEYVKYLFNEYRSVKYVKNGFKIANNLFNNLIQIPDMSLNGTGWFILLDKSRIDSLEEYNLAIDKAFEIINISFKHALGLPLDCLNNDLTQIRDAISKRKDTIEKYIINKLKSYVPTFSPRESLNQIGSYEKVKEQIESVNKLKNEYNKKFFKKDLQRLFRDQNNNQINDYFVSQNEAFKLKLESFIEKLNKKVCINDSYDKAYLNLLLEEIVKLKREFELKIKEKQEKKSRNDEQESIADKLDYFVLNHLIDMLNKDDPYTLDRTYEIFIGYCNLDKYLQSPEDCECNLRFHFENIFNYMDGQYDLVYITDIRKLEQTLSVYHICKDFCESKSFADVHYMLECLTYLNLPCDEEVIHALSVLKEFFIVLKSVNDEQQFNLIKRHVADEISFCFMPYELRKIGFVNNDHFEEFTRECVEYVYRNDAKAWKVVKDLFENKFSYRDVNYEDILNKEELFKTEFSDLFYKTARKLFYKLKEDYKYRAEDIPIKLLKCFLRLEVKRLNTIRNFSGSVYDFINLPYMEDFKKHFEDVIEEYQHSTYSPWD